MPNGYAAMMISEFVQRRQALLDLLPERSVVLVASGQEVIRNRDVDYPFRAQSDFHYLTGFSEPDAVLVLRKTDWVQSSVFVRPKDPEQETWQGRRLGVEAAALTLQVDEAYAIEALDSEALTFLENIEHVFFSFSDLQVWQSKIALWLPQLKSKVRKGVMAPSQLRDLDSILHEQRLVKSESEIQLMRRAAQITVQGHLSALKMARPGLYEYQVQGHLEQTFRSLGSKRVAFNSIVASGDNACILHYTENSSRLQAGQLLLVDAGAEFAGYAGDITSTFPVDGKFTPAQKQLYQIVLDAQQAAIQAIRPGISYEEMHLASSRVIVEGLLGLGLLHGELEALHQTEAYKRFFMHGTGHWLGRDVHDVGRYKLNGQWRPLVEGMVVTVEPGLYIPLDAEDVPEAYRGIGIRIEDDVLVTSSGAEVLTLGLPRTPEEIELWMQQNSFNPKDL